LRHDDTAATVAHGVSDALRKGEFGVDALGDTIRVMLPSAVGVAVSPFPIIAVALMLITARGRINGPAFILGWVMGLATIGAVLLSAAGTAGASSAPAERTAWGSVVPLVLGLLLLLIALGQWRQRPRRGDPVEPPRWMEAIDQFSPVKAAGAGVVLSTVNPKNLLLAVAGAAAIAQTGKPMGLQAVAYAVFIAVATTGVGAPVAIYFAMGQRAHPPLDRLRHWMARHSALVLAVLSLVLGLKLIADGIAALP
jgi:threonine/homoserine/homoserine lactone efflux protein